MKQGASKRTVANDLLRYFGFPLFAVAVVVAAFFATGRQVADEIRKGTYMALHDATVQQNITVTQYMNLLTTRIELIGENFGDAQPKVLIEKLQTELEKDAGSVETGYADMQGNLFSGDSAAKRVNGEVWFQKSIAGETVISVEYQNDQDNQVNVRISAPVRSDRWTTGVLFFILDGERINHLFRTLAYDGAAFSFILDARGEILFLESGKGFAHQHHSVYDLVNNTSLSEGNTVENLKNKLRAKESAEYVFVHDGISYYAVSNKLNVSNWYITSVIDVNKADYIQRQVGLYQMGMLFIMLLMGIAMTVQAYNHERESVRKLERDKDLLQQSAKRYQLITQLSNEVFFEVDLNSGIISFNDSFESMFGAPAPLCTIDRLDDCISLFYESDYKLFHSLINRLRAGDAEARDEIRMINARGIVRWKLVEIFSIFDQSGQSTHLVGKIADIDRQKQSMQRLIRRADSDPLTGLLNRGAMERNVNDYLAIEGAGKTHALIILDFDNFKTVNDTLGHANGDNLLVSFAAGMRRLFRAGDELSRIGGDEYMAFIKNICDDDAALDKGEALRTEIAELSRKIGIPVSISVGISICPRDGIMFDALYKAADSALYSVKNHGKNAVALYNGSENHSPDAREKAERGEQDHPVKTE